MNSSGSATSRIEHGPKTREHPEAYLLSFLLPEPQRHAVAESQHRRRQRRQRLAAHPDTDQAR